MNRRDVLVALLALSGTGRPLSGFAQSGPPAKPVRIGLLPAINEGFRKWVSGALGVVGWIEGKDFEFVWFESEARTEELDSLAKSMVEARPDLILVMGDGLAIATQKATATIPIVLLLSGYPVEEHLANSLARPGKNLTGNTVYAGTGIWGKLIELLRDASPRIRRIGILFGWAPPILPQDVTDICLAEMKQAARAYNLTLHTQLVPFAAQVEPALAKIAAARCQGLVATGGPSLVYFQQSIAKFAIEKRIPLITESPGWPLTRDPSPMMSYVPPLNDLLRVAVSYIDKILKGARAGDLPIQQPSKFELTLNAKTAKSIGLKIPQSLILRADRVIE